MSSVLLCAAGDVKVRAVVWVWLANYASFNQICVGGLHSAAGVNVR